MSQVPLLAELRATLSDYLDGWKPSTWPRIALALCRQQLVEVDPRSGGGEDAEGCWRALTDAEFESRVLASYQHDDEKDDGYAELSRRLMSNARALFATALAAATIKSGRREHKAEDLRRWCRRAVAALDPGWRDMEAVSAAFDSSLPDDKLLPAILSSLGPSNDAEAAVRVWSYWWLRSLSPGPRGARRTWFAWEYSGRFGADEVEVADTDVECPAFVVHPKSALLAVRADWLGAAVRAWELSGCRDDGRAVMWHLHLKAGRRPFAGNSAGAAFYVTLACLRQGYRCVRERAVLAALPEGDSRGLVGVGFGIEKINGLPDWIEKVALAESQQGHHPEEDKEDGRVQRLRALDDAVEFVSCMPAKVRRFLEKEKSDAGGGAWYFEPVLYAPGEASREGGGGEGAATSVDSDTGALATRRTLIDMLLGTSGPKGIAVLGDGGSGKTRLAEKLAADVAARALTGIGEHTRDLADSAPCIVLRLDVEHLTAALFAEGDGIDDERARSVLERAAGQGYASDGEAVRYTVGLTAGKGVGARVLLVLDNIDSAPPLMTASLTAFLRRVLGWPGCRLLLTSRLYSFDSDELPGVEAYRLRELAPPQVYGYVNARLTSDPSRAESVRRLLRSDASFLHLARVPFLLECMCVTVGRWSEGMRPTRSALYEKFFLEPLGDKDDLSAARMRLRFLQNFGMRWFESYAPSAEVDVGMVEEWLGRSEEAEVTAAPNSIGVASSDPELNSVAWRQALVKMKVLRPTTRDQSLCRATHPSFIEYLAGAYLGGQISRHKVQPGEAAGRAADPKWRALLPFAASKLNNPLPFFDELLGAADPFHLRLQVAAACLAEIGSCDSLKPVARRVAAALVALLRSPSRFDRRHAVSALGLMSVSFGDVVGPILTPLLGAPEGEVRAAAHEVACIIGGESYVALATAYVAQPSAAGRDRVLRALATTAPNAAAAAAAVLIGDADPLLQAVAAETLSLSGEGHLNPLVEMLKVGDGWARHVAGRALAASGGEAVAALLDEICESGSPSARAAAVGARAALGGPGWAQKIFGLAEHPDTEVRLAVASALGLGTGAEFVGPLLKLIEDDDERVVLVALDSLARAGADLKPILHTISEHRYASVRMRAAEFLFRLDPSSGGLGELLSAVEAGDDEACHYALNSLADLRDRASVDHLLYVFRRSPPARQREIADVLGRIGDERAVDPLLPLLRSTNAGTRVTAAAALGRIGTPDASEALTDALTGADTRTRRALARALGGARTPRALGKLLDCLKLRDPRLNEIAASAIARSAGLADLLPALRDHSGADSFATEFNRPSDIYDVLHPLVFSTDPASWREHTDDLASLTLKVSGMCGIAAEYH
jgi:HEAT repeat protein